jgi:hypothetical protein
MAFYVFPDGSAFELDHSPSDGREVSKVKYLAARKAYACAYLRKYLADGDRIWTIIDHVSRSGMSRRVQVLIPYVDERTGKAAILDVPMYVNHALGATWNPDARGVHVKGCGFNVAQYVADNLAFALFGNAGSLKAERL